MRKRLSKVADRASKQAASGQRREISEDFKYNKKKLKHIKKVLHNINVALGNLISAQNEFSKVKGPDISPDGMLGGLGYIIPIREIKENIINSVRSLSDVADSLADELTNPKWESEDDSDVKDLIKEKEENEEKIEEDIVELEEGATDGSIAPDDVVTSAEFLNDEEIIKKAHDDRVISEAVASALVKFNSHGKMEE